MSERMNKEQAKRELERLKEISKRFLEQNNFREFKNVVTDKSERIMIGKECFYLSPKVHKALDIAIECVQDEEVEWKDSMTVEELEKMEKKALENYGEEEIKKAVSKFSKTIKQINNRIQGKDQVEFQQMKINDLDFKLSQLDQREKHDRVINAVWTICVGIIIFLLAINY